MASSKNKRLVVLDTHAILHRAYHAIPDFASSKGEPTGALYGLVSILTRIINELNPDYIAAAFDLPQPTHRHIAYEQYKATRLKTDDDLVAQIIKSREVLDAFGIPRYELAGFEADDLLGTIAKTLKVRKDIDVIIASGDMDTLQLVDGEKVRVFTMRTGLTDVVLYDEDLVRKRYGFGPELIPDYKGLRGDPSDNIPGIKGVGEKTAIALVKEFGTIENIYKALKKQPERVAEIGIKGAMLAKVEGGKEMAELSKELATIHCEAPIDFSLPEKGWRETLDQKRVMEMLALYEFRSLAPRVQAMFDDKRHAGVGADTDLDEIFGVESTEEAPADLSIATWVIDSNITTPGIEDIFRMGKSRDLTEARKNIMEQLKEQDLLMVYEAIELPLSPVLRHMEERGVLIDRAFLKNLSEEYHGKLDALLKKIYKSAGVEFNVNSPKQLGDVLYDRLGLKAERQKKTATGARSTREEELRKLSDQHEIIGDILSYRELNKLLSTYIDSIPTLLDSNDRLHTSFVQASTTTGRLSSQDPNLQNIPIKTDLGRAIRKGFVASEGFSLVSFDYSQIELRIAAFLSSDPGLIDIFANGRDAHTEVASRVFHVQASQVSYEQRRRAKVINFGILYGMGVNALRESLGTDRKEAQEFYNQYFEAFPRLASYIDDVKASAANLGYTQTFFGRRRHFDGIKSPIPFVRAAAERMAVNAPIQGTQADIVKLAMIKIDDLFKQEGAQDGAYPLMQVHDELVFEIEKGRVEALAPQIKEIMENVIDKKETKGIPLIAEGKVGANWGEMKPI